MNQKSQDFSMEDAKRLADSPAGQQLLQLLRQRDSGQLQQAMDLVSAGNYKEAGKALQALLASEDARKLIGRLGGKHGGL